VVRESGSIAAHFWSGGWRSAICGSGYVTQQFDRLIPDDSDVHNLLKYLATVWLPVARGPSLFRRTKITRVEM